MGTPTMNDTPSGPMMGPADGADAPLEGGAASPMEALRRAREQAGLHPAALAAILKVPVHRLEDLEAGRFDKMPDMTFARALALSVCRVLKVDPAMVMGAFPSSTDTRLGSVGRNLNEPLPPDFSLVPTVFSPEVKARRAGALGWWVWGLVPVLLGALLWGTQALWLGPLAGWSAAWRPAAAPTPAAAVAAPMVPPAPPPEASALPGVAAPALEPAAAAGMGGFVLQAQQATWVEVADASGNMLVQRALQPEEIIAFDSNFPLTVQVGRADVVTVMLYGQPFSLAPHTRNNVARFEVR
jgi:cytoskeleton protein RodZ